MPFVTSRRPSIQYDGTNGAHIAGVWCTGITLVLDTGAVLTYTDRDGREWTAAAESWFVISGVGDGYPTVLTTEEYETAFIEIPTAGA
jgi:hypothetical protein